MISNKLFNPTVRRMYGGDNAQAHMRTEITIITPIADENRNTFKEMLFNQALSDVLKEVNLDIQEKIGDTFECDIESVYTVARKLFQ